MINKIKVKCESIKPATTPSDYKVAKVKMANGCLEELILIDRWFEEDFLKADVILEDKENYLISFGQESSSGKHRLWVPKENCEFLD